MRTIYFNTATSETTIAIFEGSLVVAEERWPAHTNESQLLLPRVQVLLKGRKLCPQDIDRVLVCLGPGGFTSIRIGVSAANAWSFAQKVPLGSVSVFDLYAHPEAFVVVSANPQEAWLRAPGRDPRFVQREELKLPSSFLFGGLVSPQWKTFFEERGGRFHALAEYLPDPESFVYQQIPAVPWYYKDPHITWSEKHHAVHRLNTDR